MPCQSQYEPVKGIVYVFQKKTIILKVSLNVSTSTWAFKKRKKKKKQLGIQPCEASAGGNALEK